MNESLRVPRSILDGPEGRGAQAAAREAAAREEAARGVEEDEAGVQVGCRDCPCVSGPALASGWACWDRVRRVWAIKHGVLV
jgi:hypothetical protein